MPPSLRRFLSIASSTVLALAAVSCSSDPLPDSDVIVDIDFAAPSHPVGRLIGWNVGSSSLYSPKDSKRHPEWRTPELIEAVKRLSTVRAANGDRPFVRFSGLQIDGIRGNDGYHFWHFANPDAPVSADDNVGPLEYMAIVDEVDADPMVTLNFGTGTASEAAEYVSYLNGTDQSDPMVSARLASGREQPWPAHEFEIGNEIYYDSNTGYRSSGYSYANPDASNGGDPAWYGKPARDVENYTARAVEYVNTVLEADAKATFYIPLMQSTWDAWGGPAVALPKMKALFEHPAVRGAVVHQYTYDDGIMGFRVKSEFDEWLIASADFYRPKYEELRTLLAQFERDTPLEIALTEYHSVANVVDFNGEFGPTPMAALGIADQLMMYAELNVERAMQHLSLALSMDNDDLSRSWHVPFGIDGSRIVNRPSFLMTHLIAEHLHRHVVSAKAVKMPREDFGPMFEYDVVHATAFVSESSKQGSVLLLNRDLEGARSVTMSVPKGWTVKTARKIAPEDVWAHFDEIELEVQDAEFQVQGESVRVVLPPHSFVALQFERG